jgi:hypothetical protein
MTRSPGTWVAHLTPTQPLAHLRIKVPRSLASRCESDNAYKVDGVMGVPCEATGWEISRLPRAKRSRPRAYPSF